MEQINKNQKPINKAWAARNLRLTDYELLSEEQLRTLGRTVYQLSNEQVLTDKYGAHILRALDNLRFELSPKNIQFALKLLLGINKGGTMEKSFNQERFKLVSGLNKFQTLGITDYGLTLEQVLTDNYGEHTLRAMDTLPFQPEIENLQIAFQAIMNLGKVGKNGDIERSFYKPAFTLVSGLDVSQTRGITYYGLTRTQVGSQNFSSIILNVMDVLRLEDPGADVIHIYDAAMQLPEYQSRGIAVHQLTLRQVGIAKVDGKFEQVSPLDTRFGQNTVQTIEHLRNNEGLDPDEAYLFALRLNLNEVQNKGLKYYHLNLEDVHAPNYGMHTLLAMSLLTFNYRAANNKAAFEIVRGLDVAQSQGVSTYNLSIEDVRTPNYGSHTLLAMNALAIIEINQEAFQLVSGLDASQTRGITDYGLSRTQVLTRNFGNHTLRAIYKIVRDGRETNNQDAFSIVSGLNRIQTRGIVEYGLKRPQVAFLEFSESILKVMGVLRKENPDAAGPYLYDTATKLQPYQIHGIAQENRTLGELNIALDDNGGFGQYTPLDPRFKGNSYRPGEEGVFSRDFQEANRQRLMMLTGMPAALPFIPVLDAGNQFIGQNSPEQRQNTGGDLERGHQDNQESTAVQSSIPQRGSGAVESFENLMHSSALSIPHNLARPRDANVNNTDPNKKGSNILKKAQNRT